MPYAWTERQAATLGQVLDHLGSTLLSRLAGSVDVRTSVTTVQTLDPLDPQAIDAGAIVLGVGIAGPREIVKSIRALSAAGAVALVVREPAHVDETVTRAADESGLATLGLAQGASWLQIAGMLNDSLNLDRGEDGSTAVDFVTDLYALANSLAALLQAPITIEDLSFRVVAFSADQANTDQARRLTILGLQVPELYSDAARRRGVVRQIYTSERPVLIAAVEDGMPRVAMRVQAGDEILGSIWAVVETPLSAQREQGMVEAARVIALTMLRARVSADSSLRLRLGLVSMLLEGGARAREAAQQLGFRGSTACVVAFGAGDDLLDDVSNETEVRRIAGALSIYLRPIYPRAIAAPLGRVIYAVVPVRSATASPEVQRLAIDFIDRLDTQLQLHAGVGALVKDPSELPDSRREADAALNVLLARASTTARVASLEEVRVEALMLRIADGLLTDRVTLTGPLLVLQRYDSEHKTELIRTLRSWLENFGDVSGAAQAVHVHKSTFRYRLARIAEIADIDLGDADTRFALLLESRLFDVA